MHHNTSRHAGSGVGLGGGGGDWGKEHGEKDVGKERRNDDNEITA